MEDTAIIDLFWHRSEYAITETSSKYGRYLSKVAYNILSSAEDAEECVNDTYHATWNALPPTRPQRFLAFLSKITRNLSLDRYDYNNAQKRSPHFEVILSELESCIPAPLDTEQTYENQQIPPIINQFLTARTTIDRVIFVRRYFYSDSIQDIALQCNCTEGKVKSSLFRTRNKLRIHLETEGIAL